MKMLNSGFTLIGLMIVLAIIGILVVVGISQHQNYVARTQVTEALALASGAKTAIAEYFNTNGTLLADNADAGLSDATDVSGNYVESVTVSVADDKALITTIFFSTDAHSKLQGKSMVLTALDTGGSIGFSCSGRNIERHLPSSCAEVTGTVIVAASSSPVKQSGGIDYGTPWERKFSDKGSTACWNQAVADKVKDGNGWVVGPSMVEETEWLTQHELRALATADKGYSQRRMRSLTPELYRLLAKCVGKKATWG